MNMRCKTRLEMRVYAVVFLIVCCFLCFPCASEELKANNASTSIGMIFDYLIDVILSKPSLCIFKIGLSTAQLH